MTTKTATIKIRPETRDRLKTVGTMGATYDQVINDLLDESGILTFVMDLNRELHSEACEKYWEGRKELEEAGLLERGT